MKLLGVILVSYCSSAVHAFSVGLNAAGRSRVLKTTLSSSSSSDDATGVVQESSASKYSGAGPIQVDMNDYNLAIESISEEWTAVIQPATPLQEEGIYLGAKNKKDIMVDTVKVEFPRGQGGLGLELLELAGGREDGLGIVIVSGLVEGGASMSSGVMVGDSLSKVAVKRKSSSGGAGGLEEMEEVVSVPTECFGYDKTVEAIMSLPPPESDDETILLTIKRLRRKPKVKVNFQYPPGQDENDCSIELFAGENLRRAMLVRGIKLNDPLARRFDNGGTGDCGAEGTCGKSCLLSTSCKEYCVRLTSFVHTRFIF